MDTRREEREREGSSSASFFISKTSVFDILEHLNRILGSSLIANFLITMKGPRRVITCFRGSPKETAGSYAILRVGRAQSLNAPLLRVAMYSSYETGTLFRLFVERPSRHFFLALSSS